MKYYLEILLILFILSTDNLHSQCSVLVDTANISHIICPNGGAVGSAQIIQANYLNYSWQNIQTGNFFNTGGIPGNTSRSDLEAGLYVITASLPYSNSCPNTIYSDTFEIRMPTANIQSSPTQACPNECNVSLSLNLIGGIVPTNYSYSVDGLLSVTANQTFTNMCGGSHTYEVFADGQSCGIENFGISQFAPLNLSTNVVNSTCTQAGSATVQITGVGASSLNNYCISIPQYSAYSTIDNVSLIGDSLSISNNTAPVCNLYSDFTSIVANVTPGSSYTLDLNIGTCHTGGFALVDIANVFVDWNIDGDFDDANELIAQIPPTQSPSFHSLNFTVPLTAIPGQSRMRIVLQNSDYQPNNQANACDNNTAWFGETEDYTLLVYGSVAMPVSYLWSDGQTTPTATNLSSGTYTVSIADANGCSATDTAVVMGTSNTSVVASSNQVICSGGVPNSLSAVGNSTGTYSWYPSTYFTDPNVQNPVFSTGLNSTTVFVVTFTDTAGCTSTDSVNITVNPLPTATLSAIPNPACLGDSILLTASTSLPVSLYRFQFDNGGGWTNITNPGMSTTNPQIYNNISATTQFRVKVREDNGCNTGPWSPIITVPITNITTSLTPSSLQMYCQNTPISNITVIANGGVPPYQYQWYEYSPPLQSSAANIIPNEIDSFFVPPTNIPGITYNFCIVTGGSCIDTTGIIAVEIVSEPIFTIQPQDSTVCMGSNLTINVEDSLSQTIGQTTHIYQWYENSICDTTVSGGSVPCTGPGNNTDTYTPQTTIPGTTYYYCTVVIPQIAGCNTVISECAEIIVNPVPTVMLSVSPNPACLGDDILLTASTSIPVNMYRFQYSTGSGWIDISTPAFDVINPVVFSNISTTTQFRVQVLEDNGCINSSWSSIITVPINMIVTPAISHN